MKKYLLIGSILFGITAASAQNVIQQKVDSLKKVLATLHDSARVDCLNQIAQECLKWCEGWPLSTIARADSSYPYAKQANDEAKRVGYLKGIAYSLVRLGACEMFRSNEYSYLGKDQVPEVLNKWETYVKETIPLGEKLGDNELLGGQYGGLAEIAARKNDINNYLKYSKIAIHYFHLSGNEDREAETCTLVCNMYATKGELDAEGFDYCQRSLQLTQKALKKYTAEEDRGYTTFFVQLALINMSDLYKAAGDYSTALNFLQQGQLYHIPGSYWTSDMSAEKGKVFQLMGKYDSSMFYLNKFQEKGQKDIKGRMYLSETYALIKSPDKALSLINACIDSLRNQRGSKKNKGYPLGKALSIAASIYLEKNNYPKALNYTKEAFLVFKNHYARPDIMNTYELFSKIYHRLGANDSAYAYLVKYMALKDSIRNTQFLFQLDKYKRRAEDEKKQGQIGLLSKDNKIKDQQLKQQGLIKKILIVGFILFSLIGIFIFRTLMLKKKNEKLRREQVENDMKVQLLENEKKHVDLQRQAAELEMQALRAQMNPHFIFNCLSSINRFILKNESKAASNYLTRFSRLIRMVLINSQKSLVALEDELQMLRLYLDMERLRFKDSFDYGITFLNSMDGDNIFIPPLLLQPFCENAIWHGLMNKEGHGMLSIEISMQEDILSCTITDNGIGRKKAEEMNSKSAENKKSMGLKITTDRLALLNRDKGVHTFYQLEDLFDAEGNPTGTRVNLKISFKESIEELV